MIEALGDRLKTFADILKLGRFFFTETPSYDPDAVKKRLRKDGVPAMLGELSQVLADTEPFDLAPLEKAVHDYAEKTGRKMGDVVNPLRVAVTGQGVGPGLYDCLVILGRETCRARIARAIEMLREESRRAGAPTPDPDDLRGNPGMTRTTNRLRCSQNHEKLRA